MKLEVGENRSFLRYEVEQYGNDLVVHIDGGASHLGGVTVMGKYEIRNFSFPDHKELFLTESLAKALFDAFHCHVLVSGGVHYDDITKEEIEKIMTNHQYATKKIISLLKERAGESYEN